MQSGQNKRTPDVSLVFVPQRWWEKPHLTSCDLKCGLESNRWWLTHSCNLYLKLKVCYFRQSSENLFDFSVAVLGKKKVFTFARSLHTSVCRRQAWCSTFMGFFFFDHVSVLSLPQSRSSTTSAKSAVGSRGGGSWKGPSTRLRPVARAMPPAPFLLSPLPVPHKVRNTRPSGCVMPLTLLDGVPS